jgi:hypothetical protein
MPQLADPRSQQVLQDRGPYLAMFFIATVVSFIFYVGAYPATEFVYELIYSTSDCSEDECWKNNSVYRISLALTLYFSGAFVISSFRSLSDLQASFKLPTCVKVLPLIGFLVLTFCLEISVFEGYATASLYFSGLFLFLQVLVFLDFAHDWNDRWRENGNQVGLLIFSLVLIAIAITCWILFFVYLNSENCSTFSFYISFTIVLSVGVTLLSISEIIEYGALLPSCIVVVYATYLLYSSLTADSDSGCSSIDSSSVWVSLIGFVLSSIAIIYSSWNLSNSYNMFGISHSAVKDEDKVKYDVEIPKKPDSPVKVGPSAPPAEDFAPSAPPEESPSQSRSEPSNPPPFDKDEPFIPNPKAWMFFYFVMILASMYMGVVLTGWSTYVEDDGNDGGSTGQWILIVTQWATFLLYIWTLVAPKLFPNRDFSGST